MTREVRDTWNVLAPMQIWLLFKHGRAETSQIDSMIVCRGGLTWGETKISVFDIPIRKDDGTTGPPKNAIRKCNLMGCPHPWFPRFLRVGRRPLVPGARFPLQLGNDGPRKMGQSDT